MRNANQKVTWAAAVLMAVATAAGSRGAEVSSVSPGSTVEAVLLSTACPTFSWSGSDRASGYELVVYRVDEQGALEEVQRRDISGGRAAAWTPSSDTCPDSGSEYAWVVRAISDDAAGPWSQPLRFKTPSVPTDDEVREALSILRHYAGDTTARGEVTIPLDQPPDEAVASFAGRTRIKVLSAKTIGEPLPPAVTIPTSFSLSLDGDVNLGGALFRNGLPILHATQNDAGTGVGYLALENVTTGGSNTAVGHFALNLNSSGSGNTAVGTESLLANWSGSNNTVLGRRAMRANYSGQRNTAVGSWAMYKNSTGSRNTVAGFKALHENTVGNDNTAMGDRALYKNWYGDLNTAFGYTTLFNNDTGHRNTATGHRALFTNTSGVRNVATGDKALYAGTTGSYNTAVGPSAGSSWTTGDDNVAVGWGAFGAAGESATIRIGGNNQQSKTFIEGISATNVSGVNVLITAGDQLGVAASSARFKRDIHDLENVSNRLGDLRPVSFRYKKEYAGDGAGVEYGLIAEEVAEVFPELVVNDAEGRPYTVRYHLLTPLLLAEVQRQEEELARLRSQISAGSESRPLSRGRDASPGSLSSDEARIREQIEGYVAAWNRGDAADLASYVDPDGTRINNAGRIFSGRSEIYRHYHEVFAKAPPPGVRRHLAYEDVTVRFITGDVAIVDARFEVSGVGPDPTLVGRGRNSVVMVKRQDEWLRAAHRNHVSVSTECYAQCTDQ